MVGSGALRSRLVVLCLLVVVAVVGVAASASGSVESSPWDAPASPVPAMSTWAQDPVWQKAETEGLARPAAQQPSSQEALEQSATQFDDLSRSEAQDLAQQTFPDLMAAPVDALGLPAGYHVTSYVSATTARVEDPHGKRLLLESTEPFATKDDTTGDLSKVDLSLSDNSGALVPDNPMVDVTLPDSAGDPLTLPDSGLSVSLADGADVAGRTEDDRVFYGEVSTDTDYITVPQRSGAQVMWQLRSPQAPESLSLDLGLPAGETARLTSILTGAADGENPSVQVVTDDNTIVDTIAAPSAVDADGTSVPAHYRLDGDRLYVDVPHREQLVKYPIMVDPEVREVWAGNDWWNSGAGTSGTMAGQWGFSASEGGLGNPWWLQNNASPTGYGMAIESAPGSFLYTAGGGSWWSWSAPANADIASVWFDGFYHRTEGDHLFAGTIGPNGWQTVYNIYGDEDYEQSSQTPPNPLVAWTVVFGVFEDLTTTHPAPGWVVVRGVNILVGDPNPPDDVHVVQATFDGHDFGAIAPGSDGITRFPWVSTGTRVAWGNYAHDLGLGMWKVGLFDPTNNWVGTPWESGCTGNRASPCPTAVQYLQAVPLRPGYNDLRPTGFDVAGNITYGRTYRIRADADNPRVIVSGDAWDHRTDGSLGYNPTIHIRVADDRTSGAVVADQSGWATATVKINGSAVKTWTNTATDTTNNDFDVDYALPITSAGDYRIEVQATDNVGRSGTTGVQTMTVGPETVTRMGGVSLDIPEDATDNDPNANQLPLSTGAVTAAAAAAGPVSPTMRAARSSSYTGVSTDTTATASAAAASDGCTYDRSRDGFRVMVPQRYSSDGRVDTEQAVLQVFKVNRAATEYAGNVRVTAKQFILCGWAGEQTHNGWKSHRWTFAFWLRTSIPRLLGSPRWSTGATNGQTSTSMSFSVDNGPVTIGISHATTGDGTYDGTVDETADVKLYEKYLHDDVSAFKFNIVNAFWKGDSGDYHAPVGEALYEMPQSSRNPRADFYQINSVYCSKFWLLTCPRDGD